MPSIPVVSSRHSSTGADGNSRESFTKEKGFLGLRGNFSDFLWKGLVEDDVMEEKFRLNYLFSPFSTEKSAKRSLNSSSNNSFHGGTYNLGSQADFYPKFPIVQSTSELKQQLLLLHTTNKE